MKRRMDESPVYNHRRGDKKLALRVASDPVALEAAELNYELDKASRGDTSNFNVITWVELHNATVTQRLHTLDHIAADPCKIS